MIFQCMRHMSCENSLHIYKCCAACDLFFIFIITNHVHSNWSALSSVKRMVHRIEIWSARKIEREREQRNTTMAYHTNVIFRSLSQPLWNLYIVCCLYLLGALFIPTIFGDVSLLSLLFISWSRCRSLRAFNPHNSLIMPERWQSILSLIGYFCIYPLLLRDQPAFKLQPKHKHARTYTFACIYRSSLIQHKRHSIPFHSFRHVHSPYSHAHITHCVCMSVFVSIYLWRCGLFGRRLFCWNIHGISWCVFSFDSTVAVAAQFFPYLAFCLCEQHRNCARVY